MEFVQHAIPTLMSSTAPGAFGGVVLFLFSLRMGNYKNNRYTRKLLIELIGAMVVASFIGPLFPEKAVIYASFVTGLSWVTVVQIARNKITKMVTAVIGEDVT